MPELPDIAAYISALEARIIGRPLEQVRLANAFVLRTAEPPIAVLNGQNVRVLRRIGKRIALGFDAERWLVIHLMIAGRLHWRARSVKFSNRHQLAALDFPNGSVVLTEAGTKRRASLHLLCGAHALRLADPGGIEVFSIDVHQFRGALMAENRTLKRALTDPRILSGIGNAYSDEILHAAQLSPIKLTHSMTADDGVNLFRATRTTLQRWIDRLCADADLAFPEKVSAFRPDMAVHGRFVSRTAACREFWAQIGRARWTNWRCSNARRLAPTPTISRIVIGLNLLNSSVRCRTDRVTGRPDN